MSTAVAATTRTRPTNWKTLAPAPLPGKTFAAQGALPKLPVPPLAETLATLKETLRPIAWDESEYAAALHAVDEFASGPAPELQRRLEARRAETDHWLDEWWDDGYLAYRDPILINVSYYYGFNPHPAHLPQTPVHRAASLVRATMLFRQQFKLGNVPPEATKEGPICMDTWRWMFDCCRVPGPEVDWSVSHAEEGDRGDVGYVVVLRRGRVWKLNPWLGGKLQHLSGLEGQLQYIYNHTTEEYPGVGIFTGSNRDDWAKAYTELVSDAHNAAMMSTIHGAAFVLCLDTEHAPDFVAHSRLLWHGAVTRQADGSTLLGLRNRWMDKPVQLVVTDDGAAGLVGEHSVMDGTPTATMCDHVLDLIGAPGFANLAGPAFSSPPTPLDWRISPATRGALDAATGAATALITGQELRCVRTGYGRRAIKAFGVSPDSWAQHVLQLAHARLLRRRGERRAGGTYEAASTRRFWKGRTETVRIVSGAADAWVASMDDARTGAGERGRLFAEAVRTHVGYARRAGNGLGIDRHLLGLKLVLRKGETVPAMFADPVYVRAGRWVLSTSAINSHHFGPYGWGEVVPDGFGIPYGTGFDDFLQFTVTSRKEMPNAEFCEEIERAAQDIYDLHVELASGEKSKSRM